MKNIMQIIGTLLLAGLLTWAVNALPLIAEVAKKIITIVIWVAVGIWLIQLFFPTAF